MRRVGRIVKPAVEPEKQQVKEQPETPVIAPDYPIEEQPETPVRNNRRREA